MRPWHSLVLFPFWIVQFIICAALFIIGLWALSVAHDYNHTVAAHVLSSGALIVIVFSAVSFVLDIFELSAFSIRKLRPLHFIISNCIKTALWLVYFIASLVATARGGKALDAGLGSLFFCAFLGTLIYGSVIYHRHVTCQKSPGYDIVHTRNVSNTPNTDWYPSPYVPTQETSYDPHRHALLSDPESNSDIIVTDADNSMTKLSAQKPIAHRMHSSPTSSSPLIPAQNPRHTPPPPSLAEESDLQAAQAQGQGQARTQTHSADTSSPRQSITVTRPQQDFESIPLDLDHNHEQQQHRHLSDIYESESNPATSSPLFPPPPQPSPSPPKVPRKNSRRRSSTTTTTTKQVKWAAADVSDDINVVSPLIEGQDINCTPDKSHIVSPASMSTSIPASAYHSSSSSAVATALRKGDREMELVSPLFMTSTSTSSTSRVQESGTSSFVYTAGHGHKRTSSGRTVGFRDQTRDQSSGGRSQGVQSSMGSLIRAAQGGPYAHQ